MLNANTVGTLVCRYKMTCSYTWPNHLMGSDRDAVHKIVEEHGMQNDVAYGKSKVFIGTPRSLVILEQERNAIIPRLVVFMQKVCAVIRERGHG